MLYFHSVPPVVFIYISQNVALHYSVPCLFTRFMLLADYESYMKCQDRVNKTFEVKMSSSTDLLIINPVI